MNKIEREPEKGEALALLDKRLPTTSAYTSYLQAATSQNTRLAYQQDIRHFIGWGGLLPATSDVIVLYLEHYAPQLNSRTLMRRVSAIKSWHLYQGFLDPTSHPVVRKTLKGIKNVHGKPKDKAQAMQIQDLLTMVNYLQSRGEPIDLRNNALLQIGFFGAFRRSELHAIRYEDLRFSDNGVEIIIPRSKTDQGGEGQCCAIPYGDEVLCPVLALRVWCEKAEIKTGYIFRRIIKGGKMLEQVIAAQHVNRIVQDVANGCGLPNAESYSSHSLRRGFATTASQRGASLSAIMRQGRWQHANTALGYVEEGQRFEDNAAKVILQQERNTQLINSERGYIVK